MRKNIFALAALGTLLLVAPTATFADENCVDLIAGQNIDAGDVCSEIVDGNLCVTYTTIGDWEFDEYHLWAGSDLADMPQNKFGSPKLGRFPYKEINLSGGETPVTTTMVCVTPEELDLDEWCELSEAKVVAHAVVARDSDKDGILDTSETGFGDGFDLGGNSWALGMNVPLCYEYSFDGPGLDAELAEIAAGDPYNGVVEIQATYNGGNASLPYFTAQIDFDGDHVGELTGLPTYCVDLENGIDGGWYCALMISSYNPNVGDLAGIVNEQNLDLANYVLNSYAIGDDLGLGALVTGGDIERSMWALVYGELTDAGAYGSGDSSDANVNAMLAAAGIFGEGYEPPCDGKVAVVLYPVECPDGDTIVAQALIAQALVTDFEAACSGVCSTCCE